MHKKYEYLQTLLASYESLAIAYSGGVDSSFLLKVAHDVLGEKALALTLKTPYMVQREIDDATLFAKHLGIKHIVVEKPWLETIRTNPHNRCYVCKHDLFTSLLEIAQKYGIGTLADGSNIDDTLEYRPGFVALTELGIKTPLLEAKLHKQEIRALSQELGLSSWDKPSSSCLLTRFAYQKTVDEKALVMVEKAEEYLKQLGYKEIRVRYEDALARIEMPEDEKLRFLQDAHKMAFVEYVKQLGFLHVTLDLEEFKKSSKKESMGMLKGEQTCVNKA